MTDSTSTVRHLIVGAGKDGNIYLVNRDSMGKFSASTNNIWQQLNGALPGGIWSTPAYFNGTLYYGDTGATLKAFALTNAKLASTPASQSRDTVSISRYGAGRIRQRHFEWHRLGPREFELGSGTARLRRHQPRARAVQQQPGGQQPRPVRTR